MTQIIDVCTEFHGKIYQRMFVKPAAEAVTSSIDKNRIERQIEDLSDAAAESLTQFFESKQFSPAQVTAILKGLKTVLAKRSRDDFRNPSAIPDAVAREFLGKRKIPATITEAGHESTYRLAFASVLRVLILAAPTIAEWEKVKFPRDFEKLKSLISTIRKWAESAELLSARGNFSPDTSFENTYRVELLQRAYRVDVGALRVGPTQAVDIRDLFVRPKLVVRPAEISTDDEKLPATGFSSIDLACLSLEAARESIQAGQSGELELEDRDPGLDAVDFLREHQRVVLVGLPGGGKSTLVEWLQVQLADGAIGCLGAGDPAPVPMLLRVRQFADREPPATADFVSRSMHSGDWASEMPDGWTERFLQSGRILLIVDGLDETTSEKRTNKLLPWLEDLIEEFPNARIVVTSRPAGYPQGWLTRLGFTECDLSPFDDRQALEFARHWHIARMLAENKPRQEADRDGVLAGDALHASFVGHPHVRDLARTPLMLAAICLVHHFEGGRLPDDRALLYKLCVEGLLHNWDQGRGIQSGFALEEKLRTCRRLAIRMQLQATAEATIDVVQSSFEEELGDAERARQLLEHIRHRAGVLIERRTDVFAFAHLTFQEYLAALAIHHGGPNVPAPLDLATQFADPRWREVIPLYCGITTRQAADSFLRKLTAQPNPELLPVVLCESYGTASREVGRDLDLHDLVANRVFACPSSHTAARLEVFKRERLAEFANTHIATERDVSDWFVALRWLQNHPAEIDWKRLSGRLCAGMMNSYALSEAVYLVSRHASLENEVLWNAAMMHFPDPGPNASAYYLTQGEVALVGIGARGTVEQTPAGDASGDSFLVPADQCSPGFNELREKVLLAVMDHTPIKAAFFNAHFQQLHGLLKVVSASCRTGAISVLVKAHEFYSRMALQQDESQVLPPFKQQCKDAVQSLSDELTKRGISPPIILPEGGVETVGTTESEN